MLSDLEEVAGFYEPTYRLKIIKYEPDNGFLELPSSARLNPWEEFVQRGRRTS